MLEDQIVLTNISAIIRYLAKKQKDNYSIPLSFGELWRRRNEIKNNYAIN